MFSPLFHRCVISMYRENDFVVTVHRTRASTIRTAHDTGQTNTVDSGCLAPLLFQNVGIVLAQNGKQTRRVP